MATTPLMFCVSYLPEVSELADFHVAPVVSLLPNKVKKLRPIPSKKLPKMCNNKVEKMARSLCTSWKLQGGTVFLTGGK
jgi:hypothetical protein